MVVKHVTQPWKQDGKRWTITVHHDLMTSKPSRHACISGPICKVRLYFVSKHLVSQELKLSINPVHCTSVGLNQGAEQIFPTRDFLVRNIVEMQIFKQADIKQI